VTDQEISLEQILEQRNATYNLLARLYRKEVDQELLDQMCTMRFPANTGNETVDAAYRLLHGYLSSIWERTLTELAVDYTHVFIGGGVNAYSAAYPFESVHTSSKRLLMQDARDEVLAIYRANGIVKQESWKEGEDHIALELEFEQILGARTLEALRNDDEDAALVLLKTQYNFLEDHLLSWIPMLLTEIEKFAKTDFYKALGLWTLGFLETDSELLGDILEEEQKED
jgi:TorA maturation chaperone TorD